MKSYNGFKSCFIRNIVIYLFLFTGLSLYAIKDNNSFNQNMNDVNYSLGLNKNYKPKYFIGEKGKKIAYDIFTPNAGKQPDYAVVILHGFGQSYVDYAEFMYDLENLSGNNIQFYVMDFRGFGFSDRFDLKDKNAAHMDSFDNCISDLKNFMDNVVRKNFDWKNKPVYLFAHSMGGGISLDFLEHYHGYFNKVVLNSPMVEPVVPLVTNKWLSEHYPELLKSADFNIISVLTGFMAIFNGKSYAAGQKDRSGNADFKYEYSTPDSTEPFIAKITHSQNRFNNWEGVIAGGNVLKYKTDQYGNIDDNYAPEKIHYDSKFKSYNGHNVGIGGTTWSCLHKLCTLSITIKHRARYHIDTVPMLIFEAGKDGFVSTAQIDKLASKVSNIKIVKYPEAYHEIFNEIDSIRGDGTVCDVNNPQTFIDNLMSFLDIPVKSEKAVLNI